MLHRISKWTKAILFAYFEILLLWGNPAECFHEVTRLGSMDSLLLSQGFHEMIFEDWRQTVIELLQKIANAMPCTGDMAVLTDAFNDPSTSSAIIQYFRVSGQHVSRYLAWLD